MKKLVRISLAITAFALLTACPVEEETRSVNRASSEANPPEPSIEDSVIQPSLIMEKFSPCLPMPDSTYLKWSDLLYGGEDLNMEYQGCEVYYYLVAHLDSVSEKNIIQPRLEWGDEIWEQEFENGISYSYNDVKSGYLGSLKTSCTNRSHFLRVMAEVIRITYEKEQAEAWPGMNHVWKDDSSRYEPIEQKAGCYYRVKREKDSTMSMSWYCGC
ncbi:hypothetical protein JYT74_03000 [Crocinitomix catalasitica]|nr:hypothetical protein [Crocinitomix catalasitica]